jgi:excisionase family DNA binding protein
MNIDNIKNIEELPLFLTVSDVSQVIGICLGKAYELFHSKDFPSIKFGKKFVVSKIAFIEWMKSPKNMKGCEIS